MAILFISVSGVFSEDNENEKQISDDKQVQSEADEGNAPPEAGDEPVLSDGEGEEEPDPNSQNQLNDSWKAPETVEVDRSGSFSWSMPIEIPAGTNGMQPSLSVS